MPVRTLWPDYKIRMFVIDPKGDFAPTPTTWDYKHINDPSEVVVKKDWFKVMVPQTTSVAKTWRWRSRMKGRGMRCWFDAGGANTPVERDWWLVMLCDRAAIDPATAENKCRVVVSGNLTVYYTDV